MSKVTPIFRNSDERREWEGGAKSANDHFYAPWNRPKKPKFDPVTLKPINQNVIVKK